MCVRGKEKDFKGKVADGKLKIPLDKNISI